MNTEHLNELVESLGNNIGRLSYNTKTECWVIHYKNNLPIDLVDTDELIEFLHTA